MKLLDEIQAPGFHSSLITSYSCDLPFYNSVIQTRLRSSGCLNNILLTDDWTYARSLATLGLSAGSAGRTYLVVPVRSKGAFHPKLVLRIGQNKAKLLVGSANTSVCGFGTNVELMTAIVCTEEPSPEQSIICRAFDYILSFLDQTVPSVAHRIERIIDDSPWLSKSIREEGPLLCEDGSLLDIVFAPQQPILEHFVRTIASDPIGRLVVVAPFWDERLKALSALQSMTGAHEVTAIIQEESANFPVSALTSIGTRVQVKTFNKTSHCKVEGKAVPRYLHAKLIIAEGQSGDHVLSGSANCSVAALGIPGFSPINAEACLYRKVGRGTALNWLGLTEIVDGPPLSAQALSTVQWRVPEAELGDHGVDSHVIPGHFEANARKVHWWPANGVDATGAHIELLDAYLDPIGDRHFVAPEGSHFTTNVIEGWPAGGRFARAYLASGDTTSPSLIHFTEDLRRAAPGVRGAKLHDLFEKIFLGESSFLDMLKPLERLISERHIPPNSKIQNSGRAKTSPTVNAPETMEKVMKYEEFIAGRSDLMLTRIPRNGVADADLCILVGFLSRYFTKQDEQEIIDEEEVQDSGSIDDIEDIIGTAKSTTPPVDTTGIIAYRKRILNMIDKFAKWSRAPESVTSDDLAAMWGIVALLAFFTSNRIENADGTLSWVIECDGNTYENNFPDLVVKLLGAFFSHEPNAPIGLLEVDQDAEDISNEQIGAWCGCYWLVCIGMEVSRRLCNQDMLRDLEAIGYQLYQRTGLAAGKLNEAAVQERLAYFHEKAGMEKEISRSYLLRWHEWFIQLARDTVKPDGWTQALAKDKCSFEVDDRVWISHTGPRYVMQTEHEKICINNPRAGTMDNESSWLKVNSGFACRLPHVTYPVLEEGLTIQDKYANLSDSDV